MKPLSPMNPQNAIGPSAPGRQLNPALGGVQQAPALQGGVTPQQTPAIPWDGFVAIGVRVHKDGEVQSALFDPQPMADADEVFQMVRLLLAAVMQRPGSVEWESVPDVVKRHLRFED